MSDSSLSFPLSFPILSSSLGLRHKKGAKEVTAATWPTKSLICRPVQTVRSQPPTEQQRQQAADAVHPSTTLRVYYVNRAQTYGLCGFWIAEVLTPKIVPALHSRLAVRPDATTDGKCWRSCHSDRYTHMIIIFLWADTGNPSFEALAPPVSSTLASLETYYPGLL
ncbi:hypothetical protein B0T09DRAFT_338122 [Sordaria sp. MPI-SDFR-AT-0083]|nr:hypothetical protein B0T09DRAFT_338122 [Sordaria sp. MPI-SDFR-AT-0083]